VPSLVAQEGKTVRLVEIHNGLAPDANVRHRPVMLKLIDEQAKKVGKKDISTAYFGCRRLKAYGIRASGLFTPPIFYEW